MRPPFKIGVDGGGTKTECILVDATGTVLARQLAPGCNPSVVGPEQARLIVTDALCALREQIRRVDTPSFDIAETHLFMAGASGFWREFAASLTDFGRTRSEADSLPALELATGGGPGLVLHAGTGSFVAARAPDGSLHYAGGLGWRLGDAGGGYDLGRRALARALLELQGWAPASRLGPTVCAHTGAGDAASVIRCIYNDPAPNARIAALAPALLRLAAEGDPTAHQLVADSTGELLDLAIRVATRLFPHAPFDTLRAGLSGPILTHPAVREIIGPRSPLPLLAIEDAPIEGVRRLLMRDDESAG
jgi:N-acetylglucosamine kinase-like BadF-type ATPase